VPGHGIAQVLHAGFHTDCSHHHTVKSLVILLGALLSALGMVTSESTDRPASLQALSFNEVKSVAVAKLDRRSQGKHTFHGCVMVPPWRKLTDAQAAKLAGLLKELIQQADKGDGLALEPFGYMCGDLAVCLGTKQGSREFVIYLEETGVVYAYANRNHVVTLRPDAETLERLKEYRSD
jgi:hypothetical protein